MSRLTQDRVVLRPCESELQKSLGDIAYDLATDEQYLSVFMYPDRVMEACRSIVIDLAFPRRSSTTVAMQLDVREFTNNGIARGVCCVHSGKHYELGIIETWHGAKSFEDVANIVCTGGVMRDSAAHRLSESHDGWHHSAHFESAIAYAHPVEVGGQLCRIMLRFDSGCYNKIRAGFVTKHSCRCYWLKTICFVPCVTPATR